MPASSHPVRIQPFLATAGVLLLVCPAAGEGQSLSQGSLQGEIALATGAGVPDAFVTIEDEASSAAVTSRASCVSASVWATGKVSVHSCPVTGSGSWQRWPGEVSNCSILCADVISGA